MPNPKPHPNPNPNPNPIPNPTPTPTPIPNPNPNPNPDPNAVGCASACRGGEAAWLRPDGCARVLQRAPDMARMAALRPTESAQARVHDLKALSRGQILLLTLDIGQSGCSEHCKEARDARKGKNLGQQLQSGLVHPEHQRTRKAPGGMCRGASAALARDPSESAALS
eukprot:5785232-Pleurochrysis_carterae.AAC.2